MSENVASSSSRRPTKRPRILELRGNYGFWFIWDGLPYSETIPQLPLRQNPVSCAFAATTRQVEYDMRIRWAKAEPPSKLDPGPLLDHDEWERRLKERFPNHVGLWKPIELLGQILHEDIENPDREERVGCPYVRGLIHEIHTSITIPKKMVNMDEVRKILSYRIPIIAVIDVRNDYPVYAQRPYTGLAEYNNLEDSLFGRRGSDQITHAVVLVGIYEAGADNLYGLKPDTYWIYQNSLPKQPPTANPEKPSLLGDGFNILHQRVVIELYYSVTFPPSVLVRSDEIQKLERRHNNIRQRRREEKEVYLAHRGPQ